jgi:hypothetical protein
MTRMVVGAGWHDVCVRWDISTPQAVVGHLDALPGRGSMRQPGKKLFAERDRFDHIREQDVGRTESVLPLPARRRRPGGAPGRGDSPG